MGLEWPAAWRGRGRERGGLRADWGGGWAYFTVVKNIGAEFVSLFVTQRVPFFGPSPKSLTTLTTTNYIFVLL